MTAAPRTIVTMESSRLENRLRRIQPITPVVSTGGSRAGIIIRASPLHQRQAGVDDVQYEREDDADRYVSDDEHQRHGHTRSRRAGDGDTAGAQYPVGY